MQQRTDLKGLEVNETTPAMNVKLVKPEKSCCPAHCRSRAVFRLLINVRETSKPDLNQEHLANDNRTSLPAASVIHPIGEGHHQKTCRGDTQKRSSQDTEKEMEDNVIQTQHMEIDNEESESPFHQREQSLWRRAIRILFILFIILGIIVIFMIASQYDYLEWERIIRSLGLNKCMNGFVKLRFAGMYNPPV
ncbi:Death domain-containing protein 1 [Labeo rohita]|uniref:Death domain-containing protein 1 n=1 Tax=Labeo rohita TaxID=84645 RepID=A0ABQ8LE46_LABRO|nr:uncharacterized protein si:ch211-107e6.5 [Labeo rohita]KAI2648496.1 Death domain-containing protein 1 [Labeo rohita]